MNDFKGFPTVDVEVQELILVEKQVGGDGSVNIIDEQVE